MCVCGGGYAMMLKILHVCMPVVISGPPPCIYDVISYIQPAATFNPQVAGMNSQVADLNTQVADIRHAAC